MQRTSDFEYFLPKELIAQEPVDKRDNSRLMILNCGKGSIEHKYFYNVIAYLQDGDLLILNDTKVIPANLYGRKEEGAKVEILLVRRIIKEGNAQRWLCLVRPGKRLQVGSTVIFGGGELIGRVAEKQESGEQIIDFETKGDFWEVIYRLGEIPLPPYIEKVASKEENGKRRDVIDRYQTIFAKNEGASAAPTAGLHFTEELLVKIQAKGVKISYITLHTGLGTFQPVRVENLEEHRMHEEYFEVKKEVLEGIKRAKRIVAVGTTTVRTLETIADQLDAEHNLSGDTQLYIYPGYQFKLVDAMITNFHWPRSTLLMLVSAFAQDLMNNPSKSAGRELILKAYDEAIRQKYRFYSFGDAMLIV